ncbi:hypothetical protein LINPERHAP2_LOCUS30804 [Linum perenne]
MKDVYREAEFNSKWTKMVEKYVSEKSSTVAGKQWLDLMYGLKAHWSFVWVGNHFTAGMHIGEFGKECDALVRKLLEPELGVEVCFRRLEMTARVQKLVEEVSDLRAAGQPGCVEMMEKLVVDLQDIVASKGASSTTAPSK